MDFIPPDRADAGPERPARRSAVVVDLEPHAQARRRRNVEILRCVSSGYMSDGCSCPRTIPASVVSAAWAEERARAAQSRFFHFAWRGHVWLAFGLADGEIRGVFCPTHRAERDARFSGCEAQHYAPAAASSA